MAKVVDLHPKTIGELVTEISEDLSEYVDAVDKPDQRVTTAWSKVEMLKRRMLLGDGDAA